MTQPKPYEKRVRKPLAIVNPDTQEVINVQPDAPASAASETASDAASSQGEAESEAKTEPDELENNNADLAEDMAKLSLDKSEESKTAEDSIPKASEASEVVNVEAVAEKQPSVEPPVVEKPELIHSEKASNDSKPVLEQHNENSLDDGKSKSKNKKDASEHRPVAKVETPEASEKVEAKESTPPVASTAASTPAAPTEVVVNAVQNDITSPAPEVVDGNSLSSANEKQNHVEVNHVGSPDNGDEDTSSSPPEVIEAVENGTASSSANNSNSASKSSSLIKLKYNYPEEQWSPINLEGKKTI